MWQLAILSLVVVLTAVKGTVTYSTSSWDMQPLIGAANGVCYLRFPAVEYKPAIHHVLNVGDKLMDPRTACKQYTCRQSGVSSETITCPHVEPCSDGKPPVRIPGHCCQMCGSSQRSGRGSFTEWSPWTECSRTCGTGRYSRRRWCITPKDGIFMACTGELLDFRDCQQRKCSVSCRWKWSQYSECSTTCGNGIKTKHPIIIQQPGNGGRPCPRYVRNNETHSETCNFRTCLANEVLAQGKSMVPDDKTLAVHIMEKLLETFYSNK